MCSMGAGPPCMISPPCVLVIPKTHSEALSMKLSFSGGYISMFHEKGSDGLGRSNLLVYILWQRNDGLSTG